MGLNFWERSSFNDNIIVCVIFDLKSYRYLIIKIEVLLIIFFIYQNLLIFKNFIKNFFWFQIFEANFLD